MTIEMTKEIPPTCRMTSMTTSEINEKIKEGICPECGRELIHSGGCVSCYCGWDKCN